MKKTFLAKLLISLGCVIMVALPVMFINLKPIEASASKQYDTLNACPDLASMKTALDQLNLTNTSITDDEAEWLIMKAYDMLYTDPNPAPEVEEGETNGSEGGEVEPEPYEPSDEDKRTYIYIANKLLATYQTEADGFFTQAQAPTSADQVLDYYVGAGANDSNKHSGFHAIPDGGFEIKTGTVNIHLQGETTIDVQGPIIVSGGTLNIILEESGVRGGSHIKREIEGYFAKENYKGAPYYIPVNSFKNCSVTVGNNSFSFTSRQYGGELFSVTGGTLNIKGYSDGDGRINIHGAGAFDSNIAKLKDDDTSNDNGGDVITYPQKWSGQNVEASAPLFSVSGNNTKLDIQYANIWTNNNAGDSDGGYARKDGGAFYITGTAPVVSIKNSLVSGCRALHHGGFMYFTSKGGGSLTLTDLIVENCYTDAKNPTEGGTFRTLGGTGTPAKMTRVTFQNNYSFRSASAFLWSAMSAGELTVDNCTITGNVGYNESAIICMGRMQLKGTTTISNNINLTGSGGAISFTTWSSATRNEGFRLMYDANLVLGSGVSITGNKCKGNGGAISMDAHLIKTNTNKDGDGKILTYLYKTDAQGKELAGADKYYSMSLKISGATITGNKAAGSGGAIYIKKNPDCNEYVVKAEIEGGDISSNTASYNGGALYLLGKNVDFIINDGTVSGNIAENGNGGAIYSVPIKDVPDSSGSVYINGGSIINNKASHSGGGFYVNGGNVTVTGGNIKDNIAQLQGGGAYVTGGNVTISGGLISGNKAENAAGKASDGKGGGICLYNGNLTVDSGTFTDNTAYFEGGALYISGENAIVTLNGGTMSYNEAIGHKNSEGGDDSSGGAMYVYRASLTLNGGQILSNTAGNIGGGIAVNQATITVMGDSLLSGNNAKSGGAVYVTSGAKGGGVFIMESGTIENNTCTKNGGGVYVNGTGSSFTMHNGSISNNIASGSDDAASAGGVYVGGGATFTIKSGKINDNTADNTGGAVRLAGGGSFTMTGGEISNNTSGGLGGAVYLKDGNLTMSNGTISGNKSTGTQASKDGGAVYINNGNFTMTSGTITGNESQKGSGGAVYIDNQGQFIMESGTISNNKSLTASGGAVYISNGNFTMTTGTITENTADLDGGAVYINSGTFNMQNGNIDRNTCKQHGGAIYLQNGKFVMSDGSISENSATNELEMKIDKGYGGAVFITGASSDFTMHGGSISKNKSKNFAGAVDVQAGGSFIMYDGTISENRTIHESGGAVRVEGGGNFIMHKGTISGNFSAASAGAIRMTKGNFTMYDGIIENNTCEDSGGFMYMQAGTCTIEGGVIRNNKKIGQLNCGGVVRIGDSSGRAGEFIMNGGEMYGNSSTESAGAIAIAGGSTFRMTGGKIYRNTAAKLGGAVLIEDGTFTMSGGEIYENIATQSGGAVYITKGNFTMAGGFIYDNTATDGSGGAVYINDGDFTMNSGSLTGNKALQGSGGAVYVAGNAMIGQDGCNGNVNIKGVHTSCPIISNNSAKIGGAFAVVGGSPTIFCGSITHNTAAEEGGAMYVSNGTVTVDYVVMKNNAAKNGGALCVEATSNDIGVTISGGTITNNSASENGGGVKVYSAAGCVATVVVGDPNCDGTNTQHKHPDLIQNIAEGEGGGLHLVSIDAEGIKFTMYCGRLYQNMANGNIPTGNVMQEGGILSIKGTYAIDNVTVNNGSFLRPSFGDGTVTINFDYRFPTGFNDDQNALKTITLTVAPSGTEAMYINLPAYKNIVFNGGEPNEITHILLRWANKANIDNDTKTYETASKLYVTEAEFTPGETVEFFAVWIQQGQGIPENPFVKSGQSLALWQDGSPIATDIGVNNFFTVTFEVSDCDPSKFAARYLKFSEILSPGTVIIMVDLTRSSGANTYYYYVIPEYADKETKHMLTDFVKLGAPTVKWENKRQDSSGKSEEDFLFMFDLTSTDDVFTGGFSIYLTREYKDTNFAPISQNVSCAINEVTLPSLESSGANVMVGDELTVTYNPGMAADETSIYYGGEASLVIRAEHLPPDAYIIVDGTENCTVSTSDVIIIPIGAANTAREMSLKLISSALANGGDGITLTADVYMCVDNARPMNDTRINSTEITLKAIPLPAVRVSMSERVFYIDTMKPSVEIALESKNMDGYDVTWSVMKSEFKGNNTPGKEPGVYYATDEVTVTDGQLDAKGIPTKGIITFKDGITEGNYRIIVTVKKASDDTVVLTVPYNFIVLKS